MLNEWNVVRRFEEEIAQFAGSMYAVAMESCTFAIFLCCYYHFNLKDKLSEKIVYLPRHTFPGVACSVIHAGGKIKWTNETWTGAYQLTPYPIWDSAKRFRPKMYIDDSFYCISFHAKKRIPIGRGGMVLTDDKDFVDWARIVIRDGKQEGVPFHKQTFNMLGWNAYMTPEQAARGIQLFHCIKEYADLLEIPDYPDLSKCDVYNKT